MICILFFIPGMSSWNPNPGKFNKPPPLLSIDQYPINPWYCPPFTYDPQLSKPFYQQSQKGQNWPLECPNPRKRKKSDQSDQDEKEPKLEELQVVNESLTKLCKKYEGQIADLVKSGKETGDKNAKLLKALKKAVTEKLALQYPDQEESNGKSQSGCSKCEVNLAKVAIANKDLDETKSKLDECLVKISNIEKIKCTNCLKSSNQIKEMTKKIKDLSGQVEKWSKIAKSETKSNQTNLQPDLLTPKCKKCINYKCHISKIRIEFKARNSKLDEQLENSSNREARMITQISNLKSEMESQNEKSQSQIESLTTEIKTKNDLIINFQNRILGYVSQTTNLKSQLNEMAKKKQASICEISNLKSLKQSQMNEIDQMKITEKNLGSQIQDLKGVLEAQNQKHKAQMSEADKIAKADKSKLDDKIRTLEDQECNFLAQISQLRGQIQDFESQRLNLEESNAKLTNEVSTLKDEKAKMDLDLTELDKKLVQKQAEMREMEIKCDSIHLKYSKLKAEISLKPCKSCDKLQSQTVSMVSKTNKLEKLVKKLSGEKEKLYQNCEDLRDNVSKIEKEMTELDSDRVQMSQKCQDLQNQLSNLGKSKEKQIFELKSKLQDSSKVMSETKKMEANARSQLHEHCKNLQNQIADLNIKLQKSNEELSEMKKINSKRMYTSEKCEFLQIQVSKLEQEKERQISELNTKLQNSIEDLSAQNLKLEQSCKFGKILNEQC